MLTVASVTRRQNRHADLLRSVFYAAGIALASLLLSACAQQREPGYYSVEHDNTRSDAQNQAQGRSQARAPAQIQLGFGNTAQKRGADTAANPESAASTAAVIARPLAQAKTFLGTIPCLADNNACSASRMTLTLAPQGEWRARTVFLDAASKPQNTLAEQGCWSVIGTSPLRILLQMKNENTKANLTFVTDNLLHINSLNGVKPNLDYRLTRQADIDAIDELSKQAAMQCAR